MSLNLTPSLAINSGCITPSRYAPVDVPSFGALANGNSVLAAPPTIAFSSSTMTVNPARAKNTAATSPLWPAPTMAISVCSCDMQKMETFPAGVEPATFGSGDGIGNGRKAHKSTDHVTRYRDDVSLSRTLAESHEFL